MRLRPEASSHQKCPLSSGSTQPLAPIAHSIFILVTYCYLYSWHWNPAYFREQTQNWGRRLSLKESCRVAGLTVSSAFLQVAGQWRRRFCKIERCINQIHRYFFCKLIMKIEALNIKCPSRHLFLQENPWGFSIHQTREESYRLVLLGHASQAPRKAEQFSQTPARLFIQVALWGQPRKLVSRAVQSRSSTSRVISSHRGLPSSMKVLF